MLMGFNSNGATSSCECKAEVRLLVQGPPGVCVIIKKKIKNRFGHMYLFSPPRVILLYLGSYSVTSLYMISFFSTLFQVIFNLIDLFTQSLIK